MSCLVCKNEDGETKNIKGINYLRCDNCGTISTRDNISPVLITQNDKPESRNLPEINDGRVKRLKHALGCDPKRVLDYGCGNGELVDFMKSKGIAALGVDGDIEGSFDKLLDLWPGHFDAVTLIEVIEHIYSPKPVLDMIHMYIRHGGIIMIETTFADNIGMDHPYIDPTIGHICIISIQAIKEYIAPDMSLKQINANVVILQK